MIIEIRGNFEKCKYPFARGKTWHQPRASPDIEADQMATQDTFEFKKFPPKCLINQAQLLDSCQSTGKDRATYASSVNIK